ncbi:MAG: sugar-binding transcriptional regulator [Streptococcaceae bacterium]|jgi:DNA-binding transcriptional regulator LsrR (DeoR family)|nr:sugar-binding transcriptional regulator [Streptococcaceae bacterium]
MNIDLLSNLAKDFYLKKMSFADLAEKYSLSRYLVNKYLDEARDSGIVTISIASSLQRNHELEQVFHKLFDIHEIAIIENGGGSTGRKNLIKFAADYIQQEIMKSSIVGTLWGTTMYEVMDHFTPTEREGLTFTQFMGENRKYKSLAGSRRMVENAAQKFSSDFITLSGPLYILDKTSRIGLIRDIAAVDAIAAAKRMNMLFSGLGTLASVNSIPTWRTNIHKIFPNVNLNEVAGMCYGRPFDINGKILIHPDVDNVFGLSMLQVLRTPTRIGVIPSKFKAQSTLGALRGKFFTDVILSEDVAQRILAEMNMN